VDNDCLERREREHGIKTKKIKLKERLFRRMQGEQGEKKTMRRKEEKTPVANRLEKITIRR